MPFGRQHAESQKERDGKPAYGSSDVLGRGNERHGHDLVAGSGERDHLHGGQTCQEGVGESVYEKESGHPHFP